MRTIRQFKNSLYCMQCKCFASKCVSNMGIEANVTILKNDPPLKIILTIIGIAAVNPWLNLNEEICSSLQKINIFIFLLADASGCGNSSPSNVSPKILFTQLTFHPNYTNLRVSPPKQKLAKFILTLPVFNFSCFRYGKIKCGFADFEQKSCRFTPICINIFVYMIRPTQSWKL